MHVCKHICMYVVWLYVCMFCLFKKKKLKMTMTVCNHVRSLVCIYVSSYVYQWILSNHWCPGVHDTLIRSFHIYSPLCLNHVSISFMFISFALSLSLRVMTQISRSPLNWIKKSLYCTAEPPSWLERNLHVWSFSRTVIKLKTLSPVSQNSSLTPEWLAWILNIC